MSIDPADKDLYFLANRIATNPRALLESLPYPGLTAIARLTGAIPDSFRKRFRALSGETVSAYRTKSLIDRAKNLLEQRRLRDSEIADALGFHDAAHFSKRFKQIVGMALGAFRAQWPMGQPSKIGTRGG